MWGRMLAERVGQDLRYTLRGARKTPGFVAVTVLTLAAGIGVNAAMFSASTQCSGRSCRTRIRIASLHCASSFRESGSVRWAPRLRSTPTIATGWSLVPSVAGYEHAVFDLTGGREPERIQGLRATCTLLATLGVAPLAGRAFSASEDRAGAANVAIVSYDLWQRRLGGSLDAIGTLITLDEQPHTVIGIMPRGFEFPFTATSVGEPPAVWVPMAFGAREIQNRAAEFPVHLVARLRRGVSLAQAGQDVASVAAGFQREHPDIYTGNMRLEAGLEPLDASSAGRARPVLLTLAGAVLVVLLIACANVMNLLIARTTFNRQRYPSKNGRHEAQRRMVERLRSLPGVTAVGLSTHIPLADSRQIGFVLEGEDLRSVRWADSVFARWTPRRSPEPPG